MLNRIGIFSFKITFILLFFCSIFVPNLAYASYLREPASEDNPNDGMIDIIYPAQATAPYIERRQNYSIMFSVLSEPFMPTKYESPTDGAFYEELFGGKQMQMTSVELTWKYNLPIVSVGVGMTYGKANVQSDYSSILSGLDITKTSVCGTLFFDAIMKEPYVAAYGKIEYYNFDYLETADGFDDVSGKTAPSTAVSAGLLIQLNFLDPDPKITQIGVSEDGMQNAYLDIFATQYSPSTAEDDPDFSNETTEIGAGIRIEF